MRSVFAVLAVSLILAVLGLVMLLRPDPDAIVIIDPTEEFIVVCPEGEICPDPELSVEPAPQGFGFDMATLTGIVSILGSLSTLGLAWRNDRREMMRMEMQMKELDIRLAEVQRNQTGAG